MQKPNEKQFVSAGDIYYQMAGEILNPSPLTQTSISEMSQKDETIQYGLSMLVRNISCAIGKYQNVDEKIQDLIEECYQAVNVSFETILSRMLMDAMSYGFSVAEIVWKFEDGKVLLTDVVPLSPVFTTFKSDLGVISTVVYTNAHGNKIEIPIEKCLVLKRGVGVYGESIMTPIYSSYKFKSTLKKWWAIAMERYAIPLLGVKTSQPEAAMQALGQWYSKAQFAMPLDSELQLISPPSDMSKSFQESIEYLNMLLLRGLFVPQMLGSIQQVGTYSLAKIHLEIFKSNIISLGKSFSEQMIDGLIQKIIEYNFGIVEDYGSYQISVIPSVDEMKAMAETLSILNNAGIIDPTETWQRDWFKIIPESDIPLPTELGDLGFGANDDKQ